MGKKLVLCARHCVTYLSLWMLLSSQPVLALSSERTDPSREKEAHGVTSSGQLLPECCEDKASDVVPGGSVLSATTNESMASNTSGQVNLTALFYSGPMMSNVTLTQHFISVMDCENNSVIEIFGSSGEILGITESDVHNRTELECRLKVEVPEDMYVSAILYNLMVPACNSDFVLRIYDETFSTPQTIVNVAIVQPRTLPVFFSTSNKMNVGLVTSSLKQPPQLANFKIRFQASNQLYQRSLSVVVTSPTSGYISPIGFNRNQHLLSLPSANATYSLQVPTDSVVMTSFPVLNFGAVFSCDSAYVPERRNEIKLSVTYINGTEQTARRICITTEVPTEIYDGAKTLTIDFLYTPFDLIKGFQMLYSFHSEDEAPSRLPGGLFNCSVPHYASFKQHVHCNLEPECQGGEDEGEHCPFSPPGCGGKVGYKDKCFALVRHDEMFFEEGEAECRKRGGRLAMMKTQGEWDAFIDHLRYQRPRASVVHIGMTTTEATMPDIYRDLTMWADGTVAYERILIYKGIRKEYKKIPIRFNGKDYTINAAYQSREQYSMYFSMCEFSIHSTGMPSLSTNIGVSLNKDVSTLSSHTQDYLRSSIWTATLNEKFLSSVSDCVTSSGGSPWNNRVCQSLREGLPPKLQADRFTLCPQGHVTHSFLACVPDSRCGANYTLYSCTTLTATLTVTSGQSDSQTTDRTDVGGDVVTAMFVCENGRGTVHYTLLCDFRPDCEDGSDEAFCRHRHNCTGFTCTSGQCVDGDKRCDFVRNCVDGSDENDCVGRFHSPYKRNVGCRIPPPAITDFVYGGDLTQTPLTDSDRCPDTHFQCPGEANYCLPVYVRCNGVYDCAGHEDEAHCDSYTCPGYYRCRGSSVCVHADHLCDGLAQCPKRDDELLCEQPDCPSQCQCQGLAFVCPRPFPTQRFPHLRYLDGTHSGLTFSNLTDQQYLVWLSLAQCSLRQFVRQELPNLQTLDLSDNLLTTAAMETFHGLANLRNLSLAGNPLAFLHSGYVNGVHPNVRILDLSRTELGVFESSVFRNFSHIRYLNLSLSTLDEISNSSFSFLPELTEIDLRGCPLTQFHADLFSDLEELSVVFASGYKLCCETALPSGFDRRYCFASEDGVSSCDHLLKSDVYRVLFWAAVISAGLGNSFCYVISMLLDKRSTGNHKSTARVGSNPFNSLPSSVQPSGELRVAERDEQPSPVSCKLFLVNLNAADFLMGVSLAIVVSADVVYSGQYALYDNQWKNAVSCTVAGCLAVVSFSVSAFTVCLITLERCAAIYSGTVHHQVASKPSTARVACLFSWIFGVTLAGSPFLWQEPPARFYGGTALCIPVLSGIQSVAGRKYYLGAMLVTNFIVSCISAAGLVCLEVAWRKVPVTLEVSQLSREVTISRRFTMIATSKAVCWLVVCLVGFSERSTSGQFAVSVTMLLFPLNAALNPYLYLLGVHAEKERQKTRERLRKALTSRLTSSKVHSISAVASTTSKSNTRNRRVS